MNSFWHHTPIIRALLPFVAAIALMVNVPFYFEGLSLIAAVLFIALLLLHWGVQSPSLAFSRLKGVAIVLLLFTLGLLITQEKTLSNQAHFMGHFDDRASQWQVYVNDPPVASEKTYKVTVDVEAAVWRDSAKPVAGKAILYVEKDTAAATISYGDILHIENRLEELEGPKNPNEFNYKKYLSFHNIHHRGYIPGDSWQSTGENKGNLIFKKIYQLRNHLLAVIQETFVHDRSIAVAGALLIGHRELLDRETIRAYAGTGAMHVLAVSGLHVGIIFLLLGSIIPSGINKRWYRLMLRPLLLLAGIWLYAVLTGLSPSVSRAATMFSFVILGTIIDRPLNIYNSIAASAFFLLIINPYLITEIGFLLSYFAVIGIVYLQPKFYQLLYFKNWLADKAWAITCVSVAAQIATFPIGLLFFYQFPTFFFISNLVVIPAATLIVGGGISLFALSFIPSLKAALGFGLSWTIWVLNFLIDQINQFPYSLIEGMVITIPQGVLIYLGFIFLILFFVYNRLKWLRLALVTAIIFFAITGYYGVTRNQHQSVNVYAVNGSTAISIIDRKDAVVYADSALLNNESAVRFSMLHHWWNKGIIAPKKVGLDTLPLQFSLQTQDKSVIVASRIDTNLPPGDWLLVRNDPWLQESDYPVLKSYDQVLIDESNSYATRSYWTKKLDSLHIAHHDLASAGAFTWTAP